MSSFTAKVTASEDVAPDPTKHVKYNLGMVLGVDDFTQEFAYLSGRDQWLARDVLGYGTVSGLRVSITPEGPQVIVAAGVAVSPSGQLIRVPSAQCALLNDWLRLEKTKREIADRAISPAGGMVNLYVVLCYRDCPTDNVPIPGEPCRSEDEVMQPSRLTDDFALELRFTPPDQREEDAVRDFVAWLSQIELTDTPGSSTPLNDFIEEIRRAARVIGSPPDSPPSSPPDFMYGSPPATLRIFAADACEYLRTAFRIWVTELRPQWRPDWLGKGQSCSGPSPAQEILPEACVMLAELEVPIFIPEDAVDWQVQDAAEIAVLEDKRPYLLHLRLLQEWLLCGLRSPASANAVERPANQPSYGVVAAGIVRGDNTKRNPVYNNLDVTGTADGEIAFTFGGYQRPEPTGPFQYIVKATPVANETITTPTVSFLEFRSTHIALGVANGNFLATQAEIQGLELMLEVSQYPFNG